MRPPGHEGDNACDGADAESRPLAGRCCLPASALLLVDTFMPWQSVSDGSFSYSWNAWHGDKGVLLGALTVALVAWAAASSLGLHLPARASDASVGLALAALVVALAAVKNLHDDSSAWGSYLGVFLGAVAAAAAWSVAIVRQALPHPAVAPPAADARLSLPNEDAEGGNRTHTPRREPDFESGASANSATSACRDES